MLLNNRYHILRSLGSGGFGETFIAEDTQMPSGRWCAIKRLSLLSADPQLQQLVKDRFKREAAILEDLGNNSNQIPTLYAYFEENNNFYLVQELIQGMALNEVVRQQSSCNESYVRDFLGSFLPILDYIHGKNIIHRDIKPDNIIIRHQDSKPVLIDFGAVKEAMSTTISSSGSSHSIVIGTIGFMPSEQAVGRPVYSSDLYATGLTAIYLLTGKQPQEIEADKLTGEVLWHPYAPNVSPTLTAILDKSISSHARDRYGTAQEFMQALNSNTSSVQFNAGNPDTVVVTFPDTPPKTVLYSAPSQAPQIKDLHKTLLLGSFIAVSILFGFWITRPPQESAQNPSSPNSTPPLKSPKIPPNEDNTVTSLTNNSPQQPSLDNSTENKPTKPEKPEIVTPLDNNSPQQPSLDNSTENKPTKPKSTPPEIVNAPIKNLTSQSNLDNESAKAVIQSLYSDISRGAWADAQNLVSFQLDPNFFKQFDKVTIDNLYVTSTTDTFINFVGTNTYFYPDGATQLEERSYKVQLINNKPLITASEFIRVIKSR